ncbi:NEDD4-binding protein 2-like 1 [Esox lucius]|uniref:NEDD4-binding protein 2-like 1 n=1 Tax=Esox lucius TaxID=8010 RepID=A0A3P8XPP5_ESOLU|nr:NEDD4-binding protein 2-like 1 [Esox lucius]
MTRTRNRHIIILRGLPGTQKSKRARQIQEKYSGSGKIFSTDDYFKENKVDFDPGLLHRAHIWNRKRAFEAIREKERLIIIDNTNVTKWDMWPYVRMAFRRGYWIRFEELPEKPIEYLYRICKGLIPMQSLMGMREKYQHVRNIWDVLYNRDSKRRWMSTTEWQENRW